MSKNDLQIRALEALVEKLDKECDDIARAESDRFDAFIFAMDFIGTQGFKQDFESSVEKSDKISTEVKKKIVGYLGDNYD